MSAPPSDDPPDPAPNPTPADPPLPEPPAPHPDPAPPTPPPADEAERTAPDLHRGEKATMLIVAVIAASAALLGAAVGGGATYMAARTQAAAQSDTETAKFVREERKTFYAQVLKELSATQQAEFRIFVDLPIVVVLVDEQGAEERVLPSAEDLDDYVNKYSAAQQGLFDLKNQVALYSSASTGQRIQAVLDLRSEMYMTLVHTRGTIRGDITESGTAESLLDTFASQLNQTREVDTQLMQAVRDELGIPPP